MEEKLNQKRDAACEDRTHDLRIMRPTLFQLSQSRSYEGFSLCLYKAYSNDN